MLSSYASKLLTQIILLIKISLINGCAIAKYLQTGRFRQGLSKWIHMMMTFCESCDLTNSLVLEIALERPH